MTVHTLLLATGAYAGLSVILARVRATSIPAAFAQVSAAVLFAGAAGGYLSWALGAMVYAS